MTLARLRHQIAIHIPVSLSPSALLFIMLSLAFCLPLKAADISFDKSYLQAENAHHAVWKINNYVRKPKSDLDTYSPYGTRARASAFAISPNTFITNFHFFSSILHGSTSINDITLIQQNNSRALKVNRLLSVSATYDLALFEIKGSVENYLNLAEYFSLNDSHQLFLLGYLRGTAAIVQSAQEINYEDSLSYGFHSNRANLSGISGGPALNENGEVVGVAYTDLPPTPYIYIIKTENIQRFIAGSLGLECFNMPLKPCTLAGIARTKELAQKGNPIAQYQLAFQGSKIALKDPSLTLPWLKESANSDFAPSQYLLGKKYYHGKDNIKEDFETAFYWQKKAANKNYRPAQSFLGVMYYYGQGVEQNIELATHWLQKAADQGDSRSENVLKELINK